MSIFRRAPDEEPVPQPATGIVYGTATALAEAPAPVAATSSFFDKRVKPKELMQFSRQLAAFVRAGIPILDGLSLLQQDTTNPTMVRALADMEDSLRRGDSLSSALERSPKVFSKAYRSMLRSAELTGNLDTVLERVAGYLERDVDARSKIKAASVYPAVIVVMSIGVVTLLVAYVLPKFKVFFTGFHTRLPLPTRMLINSANFLTSWWWLLLTLTAVSLAGFFYAWGQPRSRFAIDKLILRAPVMGPLLRFAMVERFCRILSSMLQAGVSLPEAMTVSAEAMNNSVVESALAEAREGIMRGEDWPDLLAVRHCSPAARQMLKVGEDTGSIDAQLDAAARYYEREVDDKLKRLTALFEPAILIVMGCIVGFVAIALVSAMYGIFNAPGVGEVNGHDDGTTLVEMLVAIAILGITGVAFTGAFFTMTVVSSYHRDQATGGTALRSYAEAVTSDSYVECAATYAATSFAAVPGFTMANTVTYWKSDNVFYASGATGSPCPAGADNGLQRVLVTATSTDGRDVETLSVFKRRKPTGETS